MIERDSKWIQKNEEADEEGSPGKEVNDVSDEKIQQTRRQLFPVSGGQSLDILVPDNGWDTE